MKIIHRLFVVCMITSSFEIILNLNIGGLVHFAQFGAMLLILLALMRIATTGVVLWTCGCTALAIWAAAQVALMPMAGYPIYALEFTAQMLLSIGIYYAAPQLYGFSRYFEPMMRWYLISFLLITACGLIQWVMPLVGLPPVLVTQWMNHGKLARINAFNYEPSFFATYMLLGWVLLLDLRSTGAKIVADPRWRYATIAVTAVLLLSTSRTGIIMMALEVGFRVASKGLAKVRPTLHYWSQGRLVIPQISSRAIGQGLLIAGALFAGVIFLLHEVTDPLVFLQGTGLASTASHSVTLRGEEFAQTLLVIQQHPFIGRGLAGVPVAVVANQGGVVARFDDLRMHQGFPAFVSIYAASGLFIFIPFAIFLWQTSVGAVLRSRPLLGTEHGRWMHGMARATLLVYLALSVDQNFFRIYVWVHLAVFSIITFRISHPLRALRPAEERGAYTSGMMAAESTA